MLLALSLLTAGILLRQADRVRFRLGRPRTANAAQLIAVQRARANNWTPTALLAGQWVQIAGYWLLAAHGWLGAVIAAAGVAVQFRHLQEISHHAVHGVLARTRRANHVLAELGAHLPLGLAPVAVRRRRHVRDHHPNATLASDPNLAELAQAGLGPGAARRRFAAALLFPLTARGIRTTAVTLAANLRPQPGRYAAAPAMIAVLGAAYLTGGWAALLAGVLIPRLLLYPLLAWWSLLVEHTWFDPEHRTGTAAEIEAGRCLRLYPHNPALATLAAATWLPYGDLHHYAHSAHPGLRWNYLPALERHLPPAHFTPGALFLSPASVARRHYRALTVQAEDSRRQPAPRP
ncbi:fatty acid desaturase [Streptomyces sp. G-G2]|uniref:fatty acid desaturase n=1 Tax=Streptomyces sp. G-G2 TaxID=3046201 RepID=UPI0024BB1A8B|nr:fatty acid desaturase [Streptomyces sp. G-G2]MDJ0384974.1 fatty acid desaturase [Streptomyces sp. G-G2]